MSVFGLVARPAAYLRPTAVRRPGPRPPRCLAYRLGTAHKFCPLPFARAVGPVVGVTLSGHVLSDVPLTTGRAGLPSA